MYEIRNDLTILNDVKETIVIEIPSSSVSVSKNVLVGVIYRPPGSDLKEFNEQFNNILDSIKSERKLCYFMGDWNINLLNYEHHSHTTNYVDVMYYYAFTPLINRPTRITATSATNIDNIFTNNHEAILDSCQCILINENLNIFFILHITKSIEKLPH